MVRKPGPRVRAVLDRPLPAPPERLRRGPFRPGAFPSALRSTRLTSHAGLALAVAFGVCFATGLLSHLIQHPPACAVAHRRASHGRRRAITSASGAANSSRKRRETATNPTVIAAVNVSALPMAWTR